MWPTRQKTHTTVSQMDRDHRIPSISSRLAWLVAACLLPGVVVAALLLSYNYERGREDALRASMSTSRALLSAVDREFAAAESTLRTLATSPLLRSGDLKAFHAQAADALQRSAINNVLLIDATAQQLVNTATPYGQPLPKARNTRQLKEILNTGRLNISDLFVGPVLNRQLVTLAVPVYTGTIITYSLVGVLLPDRFQKIIDDQRFPHDRVAAIFDGASAVVGRTSEIEKFRGQSVAKGLADALAKSDEGWLENRSLDNIEVLTAYTRSASSRWGVAIGIPQEVLIADLRASLFWLGGVSTVLFGSGLMLAWLMGGRISRAIHQLTEPARDLAHGKAIQMPTLGVREADEVGQALMQASITLESTSTQLQASNQALRRSETRLRNIVGSAMDAIISVDHSQGILLFNAAAAAMFKCPVEQAMGASLHTFIPDRLVALPRGVMDSASIRNPADGVNLGTGLRHDGTRFPIEVSRSVVVESGDSIETLIIRDVTHVQAYNALAQSNLDLQQFAFVASHDLKTPLRSISGFVQLLERNYAEKLDEQALMLIRRTAVAAQRLEQLINDLLAFARLTSEAKPFVPLSCRAIVDEVIQLLDAAILEAGARIEVDELPTIMGDRTQLIQLFLNLIGNGIKYCEADQPVVRLAATRRAGDWLMTVSDNGIGIDEKHFLSIFDVFKRLHTQQEYAGTGIGLAVCRRVVEHHGGKIWVNSQPGRGSTFSFTFPTVESGSVPC